MSPETTQELKKQAGALLPTFNMSLMGKGFGCILLGSSVLFLSDRMASHPVPHFIQREFAHSPPF